MIRLWGSRFAALALLAALGGCGGGGSDAPAPGFQESRSFDFTVAAAGTTGALQDVAFFQDQSLTRPGVVVRSATQTLATPGARESAPQQQIAAVGTGFALAVHFDASGSMARSDPAGDRFDAADIAIAEVGRPDRAPGTPTRFYTFRSTYPSSFKLVSGPFPASDSAARSSARAAAENEGSRDNSPALTATFNILATLPLGPNAMLLLTDGENNSESPSIVPGCSGPEGSTQSGCGDIGQVVTQAKARDTAIFVAGFGTNDAELEKFRQLAAQTGGAFVKANRPEELGPQFGNLGALVVSGGVVVSGRTDPVTVNIGGRPFVNGWMRFQKIGGGCPGLSVAHDASFCKIQF